ncbi:MAG: histidine kinase [SAR86 cluster bacterium]|uniref:histidine kinase n=1 Tax=SAR86 cluster bacterium TaxID=2030880 RepID=A0A937JFR1_9GAMM|nr:histidine kinase [SAR86 cluster bacterium]
MADIKQLDTDLLNHLNTEIIILDESLSILWVNDSALANGWINDTKNQSSYSKFFCPKTEQEIKRVINMAIKDRKSVTKRDFELISNNNASREVDLTVSFSPKYEWIIIEVMSVDNLNKIIDSSKMASSQKIAANLARTLAHEVKNPLSGIKGSAQLLNSKLKDTFSSKFLKIIIDETDRLNSIVSKILTPPKKPNLEPFNIHSALERVHSLALAEQNKNFNLIRDYDPSIPDIYGDENLFIHAVLNIVKNAMQAINIENEESFIKISSRIAYSKPINGKVFSTICQIDIIDNGPGIPADIQEQVFFPMMSTKDDGSGLGLSIAQDIIRIHGGSIAFSSKPGNTIFSILLPMSAIQLKGVANA